MEGKNDHIIQVYQWKDHYKSTVRIHVNAQISLLALCYKLTFLLPEIGYNIACNVFLYTCNFYNIKLLSHFSQYIF
jgi:hypothetical protein